MHYLIRSKLNSVNFLRTFYLPYMHCLLVIEKNLSTFKAFLGQECPKQF